MTDTPTFLVNLLKDKPESYIHGKEDRLKSWFVSSIISATAAYDAFRNIIKQLPCLLRLLHSVQLFELVLFD